MTQIFFWDIPARFFHFAFAASVTAAMGIGFLVDDDNPLFQLHMIFGLVALSLLLIRIVMGLVGSRYSRFSSFPVHPREVVGYLTSAMVTDKKEGAAEDAISSSRGVWGAVIAILAGAWIVALFAGHDARTATVKVPGTGATLQLGENEAGEGEGEGDHDDDDD
jgi:cytochrome b